MSVVDRWLEFEGLDNVRDVGGLPLAGGGTTRPGVLLRSATLHYATEADVARLVDLVGLRLVLDLRTDREIDKDGPTRVAKAGIETVRFSFIPEEARELPEVGSVDPQGRNVHPMVRHYLGYLLERGPNVVAAVRRLVEADGPALVHCAAGKDRTGTFVALVLDAVGTDRVAVVEDYALSGTHIERMFRRWSDAEGFEMPDDLARHTPQAVAMEQVLGMLDEREGGAAGWLRANGLGADELGVLRAKLT